MPLWTKLRGLQTNPFFRVGLPFLTLMVASLYGVTYLLEGRYALDRTRQRLETSAASKTGALADASTGTSREPLKDLSATEADFINKPVPGRGRPAAASGASASAAGTSSTT
jgi:hypothetical protein